MLLHRKIGFDLPSRFQPVKSVEINGLTSIKSYYRSHNLMSKYTINHGDKPLKKQLDADFQSIVYWSVTRQGRSCTGRRK